MSIFERKRQKRGRHSRSYGERVFARLQPEITFYSRFIIARGV